MAAGVVLRDSRSDGLPGHSVIATDACFWGFAGVLFESFKPVAWYATPLTKNDLRKFRASMGAPKHKTTWKAPALLVAVLLWLRGTRIFARVKADSLSALTSVVQLTSKSADLNLIARELALDAVLGLHTVELVTHIPGVSNRLPDELSWMWAPKPHPLPQPLKHLVFAVGALFALGSSGSWQSLGFAHCMPPRHTWVHRRPMQPREVTPISEGFASPVSASRSSPSAHDALVPAHANGTTVAPYCRGCDRSALVIANDPRALRSAVRELQGRVYAESNKGPHTRKLHTWANVAKSTGRPDPWCLVCSAPESRVQTSRRVPQCSQARFDAEPRIAARGI